MIEDINDLLPQTQCRRCSYNGCRPYAQAIAEGRADINQCPPGGEETIVALAKLLGVEPMPLNPDFGRYLPAQVAFIIEQNCIGCAKCLTACPVDAILGAAKFMHTVIVSECTGCELCLEPCPVDCIIMKPEFVKDARKSSYKSDKGAKAQIARRRYEARLLRKGKQSAEQAEKVRRQKAALQAMKKSTA